jgi:hypothetical protein
MSLSGHCGGGDIAQLASVGGRFENLNWNWSQLSRLP